MTPSSPPANPDSPFDRLTTPPPPAAPEFGLTTAHPTSPPATAQTFVPDDPSRPLVPDVPGFRLLGELGRGGMGVVYKAHQLSLDRAVALKMVLAHAHTTPTAMDRFRDEARAVAKLQHPNVVQVFQAGEHDGHPFFALEFVPGGSLAGALVAGLPGPAVAARLAEQIARGVEHAHRAGIVHRDLKPANVLLQPADGPGRPVDLRTAVPKVADFGLVKWLDADDGRTGPGAVLGTPSYLAPEQAEGNSAAVGPAADVYAIGVILYELLTGRPPFRAATISETLRQVLTTPPLKPSEHVPAVPPVLEAICLRCLAKTPADRYPSAAALADALAGYLTLPETTPVTPVAGRRGPWTAVAVAAGLALLAVIGLAVIMSRPPAAPVAGASAEADKPEPPAPLTGELTVRIWSPKAGKRGLAVTDPGALPVRNGEQVQVEVRLSRPGYAYLLWIGADGEANALYPWNETKIEHDLTGPVPVAEPRATVHSPPEAERGWVVTGGSGLETVVLLARTEPLPADAGLAGLIGKLPPVPLRDPLEVAVRGADLGRPLAELDEGSHRGLKAEAKVIDDPLVKVLERVRGRFEVVRAVRFAHQGE